MKLKYKVRQISTGEWAAWKNKAEFFRSTKRETEIEAIKASLLMEGLDLVDKLDDVQARMERIPGLIDARDPHGWRAS